MFEWIHLWGGFFAVIGEKEVTSGGFPVEVEEGFFVWEIVSAAFKAALHPVVVPVLSSSVKFCF